MDRFETLRTERDHDVLVVTIDNPASELNAVDEHLHHDLCELFRGLKRERTARAVLLTGSKRAFSAGGDFAWFPKLRNVGALDQLRRDGKQLIWDLLDAELPIVCALNGSAAGLGASVALLCDVIVMSSDAVIVDPHVNVGLVAGDGGTAVWPLLIGPLAAKRHLLLSEPLTAEEALRLGVAAEVCDPVHVAERSLEWAHRLAAQAPLAVRGTKQAINAHVKRALLDSFDVSTAMEIPCFLSEDHVEALAAIQERRRPRFEGK
ncbi:MAG: enoyl-CoA hydratase-related protein [Ilumatobacteraceae bacterium]|nr:MAG: enoyl-CoA hydratase/isomerase family protein [Actinomycetota bacterium]